MGDLLDLLFSILFLPIFETALNDIWGSVRDPLWELSAKRAFLLLPFFAIIVGYWSSILSILSVPFRARRREFVTAVIVTWFDLFRSIFAFWGGFIKAFFHLVISLLGFAKLLLLGAWVLVQDLIMIPFRLLGLVTSSVSNPGLPWIAVALTVFWCLLETTIFTYTLTGLVIDLMSNMTGQTLTEGQVRIPLYLFLLFMILGSYAVLQAWSEALQTRDIKTIAKITLVELGTALFEVMFLYREFVDAVVPWFAQYSSGDFELGAFWTIMIGVIIWIVIRALTWFLFAHAGTPTILAIIQGTGLQSRGAMPDVIGGEKSIKMSLNVITHLKKELSWVQEQGDELVNTFLLPPLQVLAGAVNFCTLFFTTKHLFQLPLKGVHDIKDSRAMMTELRKKAAVSGAPDD